MGKIVISSSYKTRKHIAATHCTGFNIGDKQAVEKRFRGRLCKAKMAEKAQFTRVNEHFEAIFNAAEATQIVFQQPARRSNSRSDATQWRGNLCGQLCIIMVSTYNHIHIEISHRLHI